MVFDILGALGEVQCRNSFVCVRCMRGASDDKRSLVVPSERLLEEPRQLGIPVRHVTSVPLRQGMNAIP